MHRRTTTFKDHLRIMPISDTPDRHTQAASHTHANRTQRLTDDARPPFASPAASGTTFTMDPRMTVSMSAAAAATSAGPHTRRPRSVASRPLARQSLSFSSAASDASLATTTFDGPHDFYAHPSYQNMMDDRQLIDSCTEAQREIDAPVAVPVPAASGVRPTDDPKLLSAFLGAPAMRPCRSSDTACAGGPQNAQRLRQWISYMHKYLEAMAPTRAEVLRMSTFERRVRLGEQAELRKYIASYDRTVKRTARARAAESATGGGDDDGLETAYLALLLQAIEAQCLLEGYPGMRRAAMPTGGHNDDEDDDQVDDGEHDPDSNETNSGENTVEEFVVDKGAGDTDDIVESIAVERTLGVRYVEGREHDDDSTLVSAVVEEDVSEDAVSSVFEAEFDGEHRPRTSLRDELLAMATTNEVDEDIIDGVPNNVSSDAVNETMLPAALYQGDLCTQHNQVADSTKLTKDMVNRWLQLNLQPSIPVPVSRGQRPIQQITIIAQSQRPRSTTPQGIYGHVDGSDDERAADGLADVAQFEDDDGVVVADRNGDQQAADSTSSSSSSTTNSSSASNTVSPNASDEPIWDGFVDQYRNHHRNALLVRLVTHANVNSDSECDSDSNSFNVEMIVRVPDIEGDADADTDNHAPCSVASPAVEQPTLPDDENVETVSMSGSLSDSSFLLSGQPRRLTMSTLKSIDDIFAVQHATPHRVEWVTKEAGDRLPRSSKRYNSPEDGADAESVRRSPSGRSHSPGSANQAALSSLRIAEAIEQLELSLRPMPVQTAATAADTVTTNESKSTGPDETTPSNSDKKTSKSRRRRRKAGVHKNRDATEPAPPAPPPPLADITSTVTLHELLENNIAAMQPADVQAIVKLCQAHLDCLNHVMLSRTVNAISGQQAMDTTRCELSMVESEADRNCATGVCRCGPIARFVQSMVTFVRDYVNAMRHWRLYRVVMTAIRELYGMAKFVSERVRWHRAQMLTEGRAAANKAAAIEFVL